MLAVSSDLDLQGRLAMDEDKLDYENLPDECDRPQWNDMFDRQLFACSCDRCWYSEDEYEDEE